MTDFQLVPVVDVSINRIEGPCFFSHEGRTVQALGFDLEVDPHFPDQAAIEITTACNQLLTYDTADKDEWPSVVRRLYRQHTARKKKP